MTTEQEKNEMLEWAKARGSGRLRSGLEMGYDCKGLYLSERCALEAPGWRPKRQRDGLADRANPEEAELAAARDFGGTIQWLRDAGTPRAVLADDRWGGTLIREIRTICGHSSCLQNWIETGNAACIHAEGEEQ